MEKENLVSIITPSYNTAHFIFQTIDSVLAQTYQHWEMIIVDDHSTDNSVDLIRDIIKNEQRIKFITLPKNVGTAQARNKALDYATGRFIAFLDSDDIWTDKKLEKQVAFMLSHNYPLSFTAYELMDENGKHKNHIFHTVPYLTQVDYLKNTIIGLSTSMIDTTHVGNSFRFIDIRTRQDTSLWITLLGKGYRAYGLDEVLAMYRVHSKSISSNRAKAARQVWRLYYEIHKFGFLRSFYYFSFYAFNAIKKRL